MAAIWGLNFPAVKRALVELEPLAQIGFRMALSTGLFLLLLRFVEGGGGIERRHVPRLLGLGVVGLAVNQFFFVAGLRYTTALNSTLIYAAAPVYGALLAGPLNHEQVRPRQFAGLGLAFVGVLLVIGGGESPAEWLDRGHVLGDAMTMVAALAWSFYSVLASPLLAQPGLSPLRINTYTYAIATLALLPLTLPHVVRQDWTAVEPVTYGVVLYSAVFSSVVAYVLWYRGVRQLGAARTMVYQYLVLPFGVLASAVLLGEAFTMYDLLGGAIIAIGIAIARTGRAHRGRYSARPAT